MNVDPGLPDTRATAAQRRALPHAENAPVLLRGMMLIWNFEGRVRSLFAGGRLPGLAHLCFGQEAIAVGACSVPRQSGFIASNHRRRGRCIAKGAWLDSIKKTSRAVVFDGGYRRYGITGEIAATIGELPFDWLDAPVTRLGGENVPIPFSESLEPLVLPNPPRLAAKVAALACCH